MTARQYWEYHSSELISKLVEIGYDPHTLVEDAAKDDMDTFEYIMLLLDVEY